MRRFSLLSLLVFLLTATACHQQTPETAEIVARVGDAFLTRSTLKSLIPENLPADQKALLIKRLVEDWIDQHAVALKARNEGIELTAEDRLQIEKVENEILQNKYLKNHLPAEFPVTDKEIEDYYEANSAQFKRTEDEVHLVHLFIEQMDKVIAAEIRDSKLLTDVIQANFLDQHVTPSMEPNGDLGFVAVSQLRPEFSRAIRGTRTGVIYGPIRTPEGYHYLQVLDRQAAGSIRKLDLVREKIAAHLEIRKQQQAIKTLKEKVRKETDVETFYSNIL